MIVVTGATGNVGRHLVHTLAARGEKVAAVSRRAAELPAGVEHRRADLSDPARLRAVVDGAQTLFLLVTGEALVGGESPRVLLGAARDGGVRRVVFLSSQATVTRPDLPSHGRLREFEEAVREMPEWTILRAGGFASNAYAWAESVRANRRVEAPFGNVGLPVVHPDDIAEVAVEALVGDEHAGKAYELTGPELRSPRQQAQAIGDALGEPVTFTELTREQARTRMLAFMPETVADGTLDILGSPNAAERRISPDIERVLGRTPRTFAAWAASNAPAFH